MSACIYRREGQISHRMMCGAPGRIGKCPWWRAAWCIPADMVRFVFKAIGKMLLMT